MTRKLESKESQGKKTPRLSKRKPSPGRRRRISKKEAGVQPSATPSGLPTSELLKLRAAINARRPTFQRQESWRYERIHEPWRKPRGVDSKMRKLVKGWPKIVKVGYRGPRKARGYHPSGFRDILVHNLTELEGLNPENQAARLGGTLGARTRGVLVTRAKELGIRVLNPRGLRHIASEVSAGVAEEEGEKKEPKKVEAKP